MCNLIIPFCIYSLISDLAVIITTKDDDLVWLTYIFINYYDIDIMFLVITDDDYDSFVHPATVFTSTCTFDVFSIIG